MSDSVKKYYEDLEELGLSKEEIGKVEQFGKIFESPDGGKTVTARPFGADISEREIVFEKKEDTITEDERKDAYKILAYYSEKSIKLAFEILEMSK